MIFMLLWTHLTPSPGPDPLVPAGPPGEHQPRPHETGRLPPLPQVGLQQQLDGKLFHEGKIFYKCETSFSKSHLQR